MHAQFMDLKAAADFTGPGAIEVPLYEKEITDIIRRTSVAMGRLPQVPATGHPHRYFEQTAIAAAAFGDPRALAPTATGSTRAERSVLIKAIANQTNFSLFDVQVTKQQGQFSDLEAKDIADISSSVVVASATAIWAGTDTSLTTATTLQYVGLLTQITQQATIALGASIIDGIKAEVAAMVANVTYTVRPTAIYLNPILADLIDREAKASSITLNTTEVIGGVKVKSLMTQAGELPLIPEPYIPATTDTSYGFASPGANKNYFAVIVSEDMVERPFVSAGGNPNPQIFQLGLINDLAAKHAAVMFDAVVAKGPSYAHATVAVVRP
jgi:hypothetical protein